jgi:predicted esterase
MFIIPEGFKHAWFADLPSDEKDKWGETLKPAALAIVMTPVPEAAADPKHWKISYLITKVQDPGMPEALQKFLVENARQAGAEIDTVEIESGHFVQISHAEEVARWISKSAV